MRFARGLAVMRCTMSTEPVANARAEIGAWDQRASTQRVMLDRALPVCVVAAFVYIGIAFPVRNVTSAAIGALAGLVASSAPLVWLVLRGRMISVRIDGESLVVRNLFRDHQVTLTDIAAVGVSVCGSRPGYHCAHLVVRTQATEAGDDRSARQRLVRLQATADSRTYTFALHRYITAVAGSLGVPCDPSVDRLLRPTHLDVEWGLDRHDT